MQLLTDQEIEDVYYTELDRYELSFARAIEARVIEKIKAQGPEVVCKITTRGKATHYYQIPEGD